VRPWVSKYDAFQSVPKDLAEATVTGATMTVITAVLCTLLFLCEATAFWTSNTSTRIGIDSNQDAVLRINLDIHVLDLACDYVVIGVWDAFGNERMNITRDIKKQRIDHKGARKGHFYTEDEIMELEFSNKTFTKEELSELDSDWGSTSDNFKHDSFQAVVDAHDFTVVNFYADWCPHCQMFKPIFTEFEDAVNSGKEEVKDADGSKANVRVLKINCVDFEETCQDQRVQGFPTIRIYRRSSTAQQAEEYQGPRTVESLLSFMRDKVGQRHMHTGVAYHNMFNEGCRLSGSLDVARVPGTVHIQTMHSSEKTLNLALTNLSHTVHHFSFGMAPRRSIASLPKEYKKHVNPLDGRTFIVNKFHQAPHHYIKVVHTRFEASGLRSYQQTHQWSVRMMQRTIKPQAKFSYDLAPVEVIVSKGERRWYDFVTQVLAIIGGAYTVMSITTGFLNFTSAQLKLSINKLG